MIAILATLALLATLLVPMATPAAAATGYTALQVPNVDDNKWQKLGTVLVEIPASAIEDGDILTLTLPSGFKFYDEDGSPSVNESTYGDEIRCTADFNNDGDTNDPGETNGTTVRIEIPQTYTGDPNDLYVNDVFKVTLLDENEIQLEVNASYTDNGNQNVFRIYLDNIFIDEGFSGDIELEASAPSTSGFPTGKVVVGRVPGGEVQLSVVDVDDFTNEVIVKIRAEEVTSGSIEEGSESLKFILPDGFEFATITSGEAGSAYTNMGSGWIWYKEIWGDGSIAFDPPTLNDDKDELEVNVDTATGEASYFEFLVKIAVADESKAEFSDVVMKIRGESSVEPSEMVVAKYTDYGIEIDVDEPTTVYTGKTEQEVADFTIKENVAGSLLDGRYITFTLPSYARWTSVPDEVSDNDVTLKLAGVAGSDGNVVKYTIEGTSDSAAELDFEDMEIALDVVAPGDLTVKVGGNAGLSEEFVIAKMENTIKVTAESKETIKVGAGAQKVGDIVITELKAGAIEEDANLVLKVPAGAEFAKLPKVTVESGDLGVDTDQVRRAKYIGTQDYTDFNKYLVIPINDDSNDVSTIRISDIYVTVDRTVPVGDFKVAVLGGAVLESNSCKDVDLDDDGTNDYDEPDAGFFPATTAVATAAVANVVVPGEEPATVVFTINDTKYTVNGVEKEMDAAPYIKDGRTFIPVRYAAEACGVTGDNIMYADGKVTLIKGDKVVQLTIGSNVMLINGTPITMDVAPEIVDPGRTMLPFRWLAQALGAKVSWDEATQTVTMEL